MSNGDVVSGPGTGRTGKPYGPPSGPGNGDRYDDHEKRLRRLEEVIVRIETRMEHVATREFIYKAILTGLISGIGLAAAVTVAITRLLPP